MPPRRTTPQPLRLRFATHATSVDNEAGIASGQSDPPLSNLGRRQAEEQRQRFALQGYAVGGVPIEAVYASTLKRASMTALMVFEGSGIPVYLDARLRECDYGEWTRHRVEELEAARLEYVDRPFPGGESYAQASERVRACLEELAGGGHAGPLVVLGHRATWYALAHLCARLPLAEAVAAPFAWQPWWDYVYEPVAPRRAGTGA